MRVTWHQSTGRSRSFDKSMHCSPASQQRERLKEYRRAQAKDPIWSTVINYCKRGCSENAHVETEVKPYWKVQGELTVYDNNLLLYNQRTVVPEALRRQTLQKTNCGHQGIQRCRLHANSSVLWLGLYQKVTNMVKQCPTCARDLNPRRDPMISSH